MGVLCALVKLFNRFCRFWAVNWTNNAWTRWGESWRSPRPSSRYKREGREGSTFLILSRGSRVPGYATGCFHGLPATKDYLAKSVS